MTYYLAEFDDITERWKLSDGTHIVAEATIPKQDVWAVQTWMRTAITNRGVEVLRVDPAENQDYRTATAWYASTWPKGDPR